MKKNDLVCIATPKFEGEYIKSTVKLMESLAHKYSITYVDYPRTIKDVLKLLLQKKWNDVLCILGINSRIRIVNQQNGEPINLITLPPILPCNFIKNHFLYDTIQKINSKIVLCSLKKVLKKLSVNEPIVVNAFQPFLGINLIGHLNEKSNIYYCYDEISKAKWLGKHGARYEKEFIKKVDQVIVSSQTLKSNKKVFNDNTVVVQNGVDFDLFSQSKDLKLYDKKKSVIGYLGTIDDRIDLDLMHYLIHSNPNSTFLFVGRCLSGKVEKELTTYPNVIFKGSQEVSTLPYWVELMDACIIPFVSNTFTKAIYPLKINEYLAKGKPVVSTLFTDLSDFETYIYTAATNNDFQKKIITALTENDAKMKSKRIEIASENSWEARAKKAHKIIQKMA